MADGPAAAWYPDPEDASQLRYWDGEQWTDHRAPATTPPQAPVPSPAAMSPYAGAPGVGHGGMNPAAHVDPWLWQSIVATLLCCLPAGIPAIVFASQANSARSIGDAATATTKAAQARTWTLVAVGLGVLPLLFFVLMFAGAMAGPAFG